MLPVSDEPVDGEASPVDTSIDKPCAPEGGPKHHSKYSNSSSTPLSESSSTPPEAAAAMLPVSDEPVDGEASPVDIS